MTITVPVIEVEQVVGGLAVWFSYQIPSPRLPFEFAKRQDKFALTQIIFALAFTICIVPTVTETMSVAAFCLVNFLTVMAMAVAYSRQIDETDLRYKRPATAATLGAFFAGGVLTAAIVGNWGYEESGLTVGVGLFLVMVLCFVLLVGLGLVKQYRVLTAPRKAICELLFLIVSQCQFITNNDPKFALAIQVIKSIYASEYIDPDDLSNLAKAYPTIATELEKTVP